VTATLRELEERDLPFLKEMLVAAALWRGGGPEPEDLLAHPKARIFYEGWGRRGDAGLVAEEGGRRIGAVWYRLFTEESHGDGFVDEETPELAIGVVAGARGQGVGRALMTALHDRARRAGLRRIALSVNFDNPAKRLYESLGYVDLGENDPRERMILEL
jgi:ribosomal protein S18 acetylase RimI-like enzyme